MKLYVDEALADFEKSMMKGLDAQTARVTRLMEKSADDGVARVQAILDGDAIYYEEQFQQVAEFIRQEVTDAIEVLRDFETRIEALEDPQSILRARGLAIIDETGQMRIRLGMMDGGFTVLSFHSDDALGDSEAVLYSSPTADDLYFKTGDLYACMMQGQFGPCEVGTEGFLTFLD